MKHILGLGLLLFVGMAGWRVGESLSSDAVSMAVGLLLGVMAGVPTALLVLASTRRQRYDYEQQRPAQQQHNQQQLPYQPQPPVIIMQAPARQVGQQQPAQYQIEEW